MGETDSAPGSFLKIMTDSLTIIIIGLLATFLGGITQGLTGFGFALVSVPILVILLSPKIVVPIVLMHAILINLIILREARKWVDLKRIWPLMIAGIAGIPLGTYLLIVLDVSILKVFIGAVIIPFAIASFMGSRKQIKNEKLAFAPVGFISGLLGASTTLAGPPVILFFVNQGVEKQIFRANLVAYFTVLSSATIFAFMLGGIITEVAIKYAIWFLPATILGAIIGIKLAHKVAEKLFRNIALIIVTVAGLLSITSGLGIF